MFSFNNADFTLKTRFLRATLVLPAWIRSWFQPKRSIAMTWNDFMNYRKERRGNFNYLVERAGGSERLENIVSGKSLGIFSHKMSNEGFKGE